MEKPKTPAPATTSAPGTARLLLALAASAVLLALGWAGLQVRTQRATIRQLESKIQTLTATPLPAPTAPPQPATAGTANLEQLKSSAAAREAELQGIITFLRSELKSANEALDRLRKQPPPP